MKSIDALYFLTLSEAATPALLTNSTRLSKPHTLEYFGLAERTFIQYNNWYRSCKKPHVKTTGEDLVDAYLNVCRHAIQLNFNRVLICEDDSQIISKKDFHADVRSIDKFIDAHDPDAYTLGSLAFTVPTFSEHKKTIFLGFSQAVVWSRRAREKLVTEMSNGRKVSHIDMGFLSQLQNTYTFHRPVIVQLFETTENMNDWCYDCKGKTSEKVLVGTWTFFLQSVLGLNKHVDGWWLIYNFNNYWCVYLVMTIALLCVIVYSCIKRRPLVPAASSKYA